MTEMVDSEPVVEVEPAPEPAPAAESDPQPQPAQGTSAFTTEQEEVVRRLIGERDKQWQGYMEQQTPAAAEAAPAPTHDVVPDQIESDISALYTDDDAGRAIRRSVETHFNLLLKKEGLDADDKITRSDVERIANDRANMVREQLRSGLSINDEVSDLVKRGVIGVDDAAVVQEGYSSSLSSPGMKEAAENPKNAPWILKGVVYDLVKSGKIRPYSKKARATNPLQPSGAGAAAAPAPPSEDPLTSPFASVRNLSKDQLKSARASSTTNYNRANSG
jgi:hypothetical protein